jgi:hypothetical protein
LTRAWLDAEFAGLDALEAQEAPPGPGLAWVALWPKLATIAIVVALWQSVVAVRAEGVGHPVRGGAGGSPVDRQGAHGGLVDSVFGRAERGVRRRWGLVDAAETA